MGLITSPCSWISSSKLPDTRCSPRLAYRLMTDRFLRARTELAKRVGSDGMAIVPAAREVVRNYDVMHEFRQDTFFWYLTGFREPEAVAVITPGHPDGDYTLFVRPRNRDEEIWTGIRSGVDGAKESFGADQAFPLAEMDEVIERLMHGREVLWYTIGDEGFDTKIHRVVSRARVHRERMGGTVPSTIRDVSVVLGEMMLFKSEEESEVLREACELSARGHSEAMRFTRPGMYEYEVQAALEYFWRLEGSRRNGYPSIVASGDNACILHYDTNLDRVEDGALVLIDAAAEVGGFSSDITRTYPANGVFTPEQRAIYEVVLEAEKRGMALAVPGSNLRAIHEECSLVLAEGMVDLGLLPGPVDDVLAMHHYSSFFMHGTSHWLGLDVHDRGAYRIDGVSRELQAGMAFTVEPGLYVAPDKSEVELTMLPYDPEERAQLQIELGPKAAAAKIAEQKEEAPKITHQVPEQFRGIGVRIEDDVLITGSGSENLTSSVPKEIDEVEAMCAEESVLPTR